ncbi:MAG: GNAT family N-acetyltransferase [Acidimicrobiales bacterium]
MPTDHTLDVRATAPHERRDACDTMRIALLNGPTSDDDWAKAEAGWADDVHTSISAWDGDRCVGHAGAFLFDTVVPGGRRIGTAGVTRVGVLPTATRQGLLTRMMRQLLESARADGRPLASLRASEAVIYSRYGFGVAADGVQATVDARRARPLRTSAPGSMRLLQRHELLEVLPPLYDRIVARPGAIVRSPFLWSRYLEDALHGDKASFVAVHTAPDGTDDGFVHYTVRWEEGPFAEVGGTGEVHDVWGASPAVELSLWNHLIGIDLVRTWSAEERPIDDVLRLAVHDRRAYQTTHRWDEQWLRLLDVEACLAARSYRPTDPVTIAVSDPWFADNEGTFEISSSGVRRTSATADLHCSIDSLSSAYLGTVPWYDLVVAGRADGTLDAAARADDLFAVRPLAFAGSFF